MEEICVDAILYKVRIVGHVLSFHAIDFTVGTRAFLDADTESEKFASATRQRFSVRCLHFLCRLNIDDWEVKEGVLAVVVRRVCGLVLHAAGSAVGVPHGEEQTRVTVDHAVATDCDHADQES